MTHPVEITFVEAATAEMAEAAGAVVVFTLKDGALSPGAAEADGLTGGAVGRLVAGKGFKGKAGDVGVLAFPHGMAADTLIIAALGDAPDANAARKAGGAAAKAAGGKPAAIWGAGGVATEAEAAFGFALKSYRFDAYKTDDEDEEDERRVDFVSADADAVARASGPLAALAEGVFFTRDLVNEPANVLTTGDFAGRLAAMEELGLEIEILGEAEMRDLGMNALLAVGMASDDESKLVVMKWNGGGDEAPLAIVGKGVVFDTGGVSIKPAGGMEDMTMDMGGARVVAG
ncbi:MAG: M17 family peptidase N-terminal domain-containing protein, partial [Paracoccaceae bacterium]